VNSLYIGRIARSSLR